MSDRLLRDRIEAMTADIPCINVRVYDSLPSTNASLRSEARQGAPDGLVLLADHQTDGYGRYGRTFHSPEGSGLYMSLLLRPEGTADTSLLVTAAAAVAVSEAIEDLTGKTCGIKWVNDLILDGRKVCGILAEGAFLPASDRLAYIALGIGVNVTEPIGGFPSEIREIAGAILHDAETDFRNRLAAAVLRRFFAYYRELPSKTFYQAYRDRLFFLGKPIRVIRNGAEASAIALDVDDKFRLLVRYEDGREELLSSGEIGIKL